MSSVRIVLLAFLVATSAPFLVAQDKAVKKQPAQLRVLVPPAAKVSIDGTPTKQEGEERLFVTPPLALGKTYTYTLKALIPRNGRSVVRMGIVTVEGGKESRIDFRPDSKDDISSEIIFVPTSQIIVDKMLQMAKVKKGDVVYDLGCGDGRIVVTAAKEFGAKGVGVDIDPDRVKESLDNVKQVKVDKLVEIRLGDALKVEDISKATVVMLYMLPEFQAKLAPILKKQLKPGTRIVAHDYALPGWKEEKMVTLMGEFREHELYLYRVGKK
jgi:uncharacterized protein (TIGR03000 family)